MEAYKLISTQSQVIRGDMELGLPSHSTRHDFLEQSRKIRRLHERSELGKACLERASREHDDTDTLREDHLKSIKSVQAVQVE